MGWTACCLATAVFPLLSVHQEENLVGMWVEPSACRTVSDSHVPHRSCGALAMYTLGVLGFRRLQFADPAERTLFKTAVFFLVRAANAKPKIYD